MTEITTVMTRKGQVTVPAPIRLALGLKEGDRVTFILEDGQLRLVRRGSVVARTAGMLAGPLPYPGAAAERAAVEQAIADEIGAELTTPTA